MDKNKLGWLILAAVFGIPTLISLVDFSDPPPKRNVNIIVPTVPFQSRRLPSAGQEDVLSEIRAVKQQLDHMESKARFRRITGIQY